MKKIRLNFRIPYRMWAAHTSVGNDDVKTQTRHFFWLWCSDNPWLRATIPGSDASPSQSPHLDDVIPVRPVNTSEDGGPVVRQMYVLHPPSHTVRSERTSKVHAQVLRNLIVSHLDAVSPVRPVDAAHDDGPPLAHRGFAGHEHGTLQALA